MKQLILLTLLLFSACENLTLEEVTKLTKKADIYLESQQYPQAIIHYEKVVKGYIELGDLLQAAQTYHKIADIYKDLVIYDSVHASYQKAITLYQEINETQGLSNTYQQIGLAYQTVPIFDLPKNYDSAQIYFSKALNLKHSSGLNHLYYYLGTNYLYQEKYDSAIYYLDFCINLSEKTKVLAVSHLKLGEAYLKTGKYQQAEKHLLKAHTLKETAESSNFLGKLYTSLNKPNKAKDYLEKAYGLALSEQNLKQMSENRLAFQKLFIKQEQYKKVNTYADERLNIQTQEDQQNTAALDFALKMKKEINLKNQESIYQAQENQELDKSQKKLLGLTLLIILIFLLSYLFLFKKKRGTTVSDTLNVNNTQIKKSNEAIITMLKNFGPKLEETSSRNAFRDMRNRTIAIDLIHSRLDKAKNGMLVGREFGKSLNDIVKNLIETHNYENIKLNFVVPKLSIPLSKAAPLGMILNELVTNCFKYAWVGWYENQNNWLIEDPELWIKVKMIDSNHIQLMVADNGNASPETMEKAKDETSGKLLLRSLTEELDTELIQKKASGTSFELTVCLEKEILV